MSIPTDKLRQQAFPVLTEQQIALLRPFGAQRTTRAGEVIFEAGKERPMLVVVLSGCTEIVDTSDGEERSITSASPGEITGELNLLTGQAAYATCVVREPGEILVIPAEGVQRAIATIPEISDVLVTAFAARRKLLMRAAGATLTIIGAERSPNVLHLEEFVSRNQIPHRWLAPDDPAAVALLARLNVTEPADVWAVIRGKKALANPSPLYLAKALRLDLAFWQDAPIDLAIVGTGPAGLSAAVYGASEGLSTIAIDDVAIGGQAGSSSRIENYLGFPTGITGGDLAFRAEVQALKFGARVTVPHRATRLARAGELFEIELDGLRMLRARSVIIATGARYRRLGLPNQEQFEGGIFYAATELEARLCRDVEVVVVGSGNSAGQAAMFLAGKASFVHLVARGPDLVHSMSHYLISRLENAPNVRIHTNCEVCELYGAERLESVGLMHRSGEQQVLGARALFVMIGADPHTEWLQGTIDLDERGFIVTGMTTLQPGADPLHLLSPYQTSLPGVFAVGDVRSGSVKRVASAVGEGSVVVSAVHQFLAALSPSHPHSSMLASNAPSATSPVPPRSVTA